MPFPDVCPTGYTAVITDVHTDEQTSLEGYDLYDRLDRNPIDGVWAVRGNEHTWRNNRAMGTRDRYTDFDLQTVTHEQPGVPGAYEPARKEELRVATLAARLVIQPHSHPGAYTYAYYNAGADEAKGVATSLGATRGVQFWTKNAQCGDPRQLTIDFSVTAMETYCDDMYDILKRLGGGEVLEPEPMVEYQFVGDVAVDDARRVGLADEYESWEPFSEADQRRLELLGFPPDCVPLGWSYKHYGRHHGCIAELARPITSGNLL